MDIKSCHLLSWFWIHVQVPEGVETPHVQHGEELSFGFGERKTVTKCLESWNHQSLLSVGHVQLHHRLSAEEQKVQ